MHLKTKLKTCRAQTDRTKRKTSKSNSVVEDFKSIFSNLQTNQTMNQ